MKLSIVFFCAFVSCVLAAPQFNEFDDFNQALSEPAPFQSQTSEDDENTSFQSRQFTEDNTSFQSRQVNEPTQVIAPGIIYYSFVNNGIDGYRFAFELADGQIRIEEGSYKDSTDIEGNPVKVLEVIGTYSHVAPDGATHWVNYQADEEGYKPKVGKGVGGPKPGDAANIDPNLLKSLVG